MALDSSKAKDWLGMNVKYSKISADASRSYFK